MVITILLPHFHSSTHHGTEKVGKKNLTLELFFNGCFQAAWGFMLLLNAYVSINEHNTLLPVYIDRP